MSSPRTDATAEPSLGHRVLGIARRVGTSEATVARALGLSQRQLQRRWQESGSARLEEFLVELRFRNAVELLTILGSVKEAALYAGYPSAAPFCREFVRSQGVSPGRFFRRYRADQPYWNDPELRPARLTMQAETRTYCAGVLRRASEKRCS